MNELKEGVADFYVHCNPDKSPTILFISIISEYWKRLAMAAAPSKLKIRHVLFGVCVAQRSGRTKSNGKNTKSNHHKARTFANIILKFQVSSVARMQFIGRNKSPFLQLFIIIIAASRRHAIDERQPLLWSALDGLTKKSKNKNIELAVDLDRIPFYHFASHSLPLPSPSSLSSARM